MVEILSRITEQLSFGVNELVFGIIAAIFLYLFYILRLDRGKLLIDKIPGYKDLPLIGDSLHLKREPTEFYRQVIGLIDSNRVNKLFKIRVGLWPIVALFTPAEAEKLLRSTELIDKSVDYDYIHEWLGLGLLTSTGPKWKKRRRMLTPSFHFNILKEFLLVMNNHASTIQEKLANDVVGRKEPVDIFPYITLNALDIICDTAMGVDMNALNNGESDYVKAVYQVKETIAVRQRSPWLWPDLIFNATASGQLLKKNIKVMHDYAYKVIKERREMRGLGEYGDRHKAFLDTLLDCTDEDGKSLTDDDIREEVDTFMFEGHDTVSAAAAHAVYLLGANPEAQKKCQEEIDDVLNNPRDLTMDDLSKLTYLEWCIKEALRIYPSVPWYGRALSKDTEFAGYVVPKGSTVAVFTVGLHRDPEIFPDPDRFDPTRFSPENSANRHPYAYVPFSAGPRNCIGQRFAMMELKVVLATLLRNFSIESTQKREEVKPNPGLVLQPSTGIIVKLTNRV